MLYDLDAPDAVYVLNKVFCLNLMVENSKICEGLNKSEFTEYVDMMLENHRAFDGVHPYYLTKVPKESVFPKSIIQRI